MIQQTIALVIVLSFLWRLYAKKRRKKISQAEFMLWTVFWSLSGLMIVFLKQIDAFVAFLGFSSSGINVLLYLAIAWLFHLLFRIRIRIEKLERDLTQVSRSIALEEVSRKKE
jgi:hypothetical protein